MITPSLAVLAAALPEAAAAGPQTTVVASQGVIPFAASFFADARPNTARDMLDRLPGFSFDGGDSVRGFGGAAGNVLIDGERPTSKSDSLDNILRRLPASQVERIDLIRGGAPGVDMQGKTVVANVIRKSGTATTGLFAVADTWNADGRQTPAMRLEGSRRWDGRTLEGGLFMGSFFDDGSGDGPRVRTTAAGVATRTNLDTEGDGTQTVATGAYETPLAGGKVKINGQLFDQTFTYDSLEKPTNAVQRDHEDRTSGELGLRYGRALSGSAELEALLLQQLSTTDLFSRYQESGVDVLFTNERTKGETIARSVYKSRRSATLSLELGGEAAYNWLESSTGYIENGTPVALPAADVEVAEKRGELFATATWKASSTLSLETGLRLEASSLTSEGDVALEKTLTFVKPRAIATWSPNADTQLRLRVEREVGQLNFDDFVASSSLSLGTVQAGNPDLDPQQAWVAEAAFEQRFWEGAAFVLTLRHSALTDVIDRAPVFTEDGAFDAPANIGEGTKDRVEVSLTLPLGRVGVKGGLLKLQGARIWSEVTDPTTGDKREISGQRPQWWEVRFSQDVPKWRMNWGVDIYSSWRETYYRFSDIETRKLKTWVQPYAEFKPRSDLAIRFELPNVTARGFDITREVYAGPRNRNGLSYTDRQDLTFGRGFFIRVRKTFG